MPAAIVARPKPSANTSSTAAPTASPMPIASEEALRLSSSAASSSSSRTSELARSETLLTVAPRPGDSCSVSRVCMASPVDDLGEHDSGDERRAHDHAAVRGPCRPCAFSSSTWAASRAAVPSAQVAGERRAPGWSARCPSREPGSGSASACAGRPRRCAAPPRATRRRRRPALRRDRRGAAGARRRARREGRPCSLLHRRRLARGDAPELGRGAPRGHRRDRGEARVETGPEQLAEHARFVA